MTREQRAELRKMHLRAKRYGVNMGWPACNTHIAPFAKNLTHDPKKVTCRKCARLLARVALEDEK